MPGMTQRQGIPSEKVLQLAARPEGFTVTWRHRDASLMKRCYKMVRHGKLVRGPKVPGGGYTLFLAAPAQEGVA